MSNAVAVLLGERLAAGSLELRRAEFSHVDAGGVCHVVLDGAKTPVAADVLVGSGGELVAATRLLVAVGASGRPVVLGQIAARVPEAGAPARPAEDLRLSAPNSVSIECGDSAITLRRDGTVVIRGAKIVSRASGENKVRGSTVKIN